MPGPPLRLVPVSGLWRAPRPSSGEVLDIFAIDVREVVIFCDAIANDFRCMLPNCGHQDISQAIPVQILGVVGTRAMQTLVERPQTRRHELPPLTVERSEEVLTFGLEEHKN
ncbi:hypothetical protein [Ralstonia syzygii]|uniref:hypothetical protein n=1 Tax=Ralstonia syzygii TaxID=28097 RepID=UPI001FF7BFAA